MPSALNPASIQRLLIIQIRPFGDVLLNTPYLPYLRKRLPQARIDFLVKHPYQSVLEHNPYIDRRVVFGHPSAVPWLDKIRLFIKVYRERYQVVIDQVQGTTSAQIACFSRAPYRIASTQARWKRLYNIRVAHKKKRYAASMKFDLLRPLGVVEGPFQFFYHIEAASTQYASNWLKSRGLLDKPFVCVSPGSPRLRKKWRADRFAALCDMIVTRSRLPVVLLWGPDEKRDIERVAQAMHLEPLKAPATTYNQAAAFLKASKLLICNDGGLYHLSVALGVPSLAIFGNTDPRKWSPGDEKKHAYLFNAQFDSRRDNSFGISPAAAYEKAAGML